MPNPNSVHNNRTTTPKRSQLLQAWIDAEQAEIIGQTQLTALVIRQQQLEAVRVAARQAWSAAFIVPVSQ